MAHLLDTLREKTPSKRALLAIGGAAAVAVGALQATDTLAAGNSDAVALSRVASQNFFPTPLPSTLNCSNSGAVGFRDAVVTWPSAGPGLSYRVDRVNVGSGKVVDTTYQTATTSTQSLYGGIGSSGHFRINVYTVNDASGTSGPSRVVSSGYLSYPIWVPGGTWDTYCNAGGNGAGNLETHPNANWENQANWDPGTGANRGSIIYGAADDTETENPANVAPITGAITVQGQERELTLTQDGKQICAIPLEDGAAYSFNGNNLSITNGNTVQKVNPETCTLS